MRIEDYEINISLNRNGLDLLCNRVIEALGIKKLWNDNLQKHIIRYGCFDSRGKYFGNLGVEPIQRPSGLSLKWRCGPYAHFNLRGVNPEHFNIYRNWQPGEFAPFMKHHPQIYKRVELIKSKCDLINIHIYYDINIEWGP
jgi:hypothetical protein